MLHISRLNLIGQDWLVDTGHLTSIRHNLITFPDNLCVENFNIISRIGSASNFGLVYQIKYQDIDFALKILPITDQTSIEKNTNELLIAQKASELVLTGDSENFPIVYAIGLCNDTIYEDNNKFKIETIKFFKRSNHLPSNILISELANTDLIQFLYKNVKILTNEFMIELFKSCLQLLDELQFKLKIIHRDLHLGNILLLKQNSEIILLAHDFGQSEFITDLTSLRSRLYDMKLLVENFKNFSSPYVNIRLFSNKIKKIQYYLDETLEDDPTEEFVKFSLDYVRDKIINIL